MNQARGVKQTKKNKRVVITGLGVISSIGIGWKEFWKNLIAGKSGISEIASFDTISHSRRLGGEVKHFDPDKFINKRERNYLGRSAQMAIVASKLALDDSRINLTEKMAQKIGICIGTTMGEPKVIEEIGEKIQEKVCWSTNVFSAVNFPASNISNIVAKKFNLHGRNIIFANACSSGNHALGKAYDLIKYGRADFMLAGGVDSFSRIAYTGFERMLSIAPHICQPFDKSRKGMIPAEGAGVVLLESLESAYARKATVYAEILGYGLSSDGEHITAPDSTGIIKAIRKALKNSNIEHENIDYINAHGTGTIENDKAECEAFRAVFKDRLSFLPVTSIKSMLGHTMGAASALETIACCLVLKKNISPPTINFTQKDIDCAVDCVPNKSRKITARTVLNNALAFGGNNACLILGARNE